MQITDAIADMLTRIRNAGTAGHATVDVPQSNMKKAIAQILLDEGYIEKFETLREILRVLSESLSSTPAESPLLQVSRESPSPVFVLMRTKRICPAYLTA